MERYLYKELERWSSSENRRPLILFGARQVGKTWLLKEFGSRKYKSVAFVSFDRDDAAAQLMTTEKSAEKIGDRYAVDVVEAHHIKPFTESLNNDTGNIIILSPSYHRIVHAAKPTFNYRTLSFDFPNGLTERVQLNKHLLQA